MNLNYSRIFEKMGGNPTEYQKIFLPIYQQVVAENNEVIQSVLSQIQYTLENTNHPQNKMFAIRLFKDLLPTASYGFMLYAQSYLLNALINIIQFKKDVRMEEKQKYLFSDTPDPNLAQMGKSTYRMSLECLKFSAETMSLHPYQRISFPSLFRLQYNRLSKLITFPETYISIKQSDKAKFSSNYNSKLKIIKPTIRNFQDRLVQKMSQCMNQGNFSIKQLLCKLVYTGQSNIIPFILNWVCSALRDPDANSRSKIEMFTFLNQIFLIGDIQILDEFNGNVIPTALELVYPLDFKHLRIRQSNVGSETIRKKAIQSISFWGKVNPNTSELLNDFSSRFPLSEGSRLYQSYSSFSQALQMNLEYRNQINVCKKKHLPLRDSSQHVKLLSKYLASSPQIPVQTRFSQTVLINTLPNVPVIQSQQMLQNIRISEVTPRIQQFLPEPSAINNLSIPGNSSISNHEFSIASNHNNILEEMQYSPLPQIISNHQMQNLDRSKISFTQSNISKRVTPSSPNAKITFMNQIEVKQYHPTPQQRNRYENVQDNFQNSRSNRIEVFKESIVNEYGFQKEPIHFLDSYVNGTHRGTEHYTKVVEEKLLNEDYEGQQKEYLPSQTIIKTIPKPQFGFASRNPGKTIVIEKQQAFASYKPTIRPSEYFQTRSPINFTQVSKTQNTDNLNANQQMLKRSNSSNGALFNLNQSLRGLESPRENHRSKLNQNMEMQTPIQYEMRIKILQNQMQNCLAIDKVHKMEMQQLKNQLNDVNLKVKKMTSMQQNIQHLPISNFRLTENNMATMVVSELIPQSNFQMPTSQQNVMINKQRSGNNLSIEIQQWYQTKLNNCQMLQTLPIKIPNKRKKQLIKNKEILYKSKYLEVGFITLLKDCLEITLYYYFSCPVTDFRAQINSPDIRCINDTLYIPYIEGGTQKRQVIEFSYPNSSSLPFRTPELVINYSRLGATNENIKVLLPCITLKFVTLIQKLPPQGGYRSYISRPFSASNMFLGYQNLAELLPGLMRVHTPKNILYPCFDSGNVVEYGVEGCYLDFNMYLRVIVFSGCYFVLQIDQIRPSDSSLAIINSVVEELLSIISVEE